MSFGSKCCPALTKVASAKFLQDFAIYIVLKVTVKSLQAS